MSRTVPRSKPHLPAPYTAPDTPSEETPLLRRDGAENEDALQKEIAARHSSREVRAGDPTGKPPAPWRTYLWDSGPGRSPEEVRFIRKLDTFLITMLSLGYYIKNLDQTNISNAFVSGMKEDLAMNGNEINLVDAAWTVGYVVGQIPSQVVLTKIRPSIWVPACELLWSILTLCLAGANSSNQVIAIRFFVGLAESIFYPAAHTILGSWYKPSELGKRACIFHASSAAASICSGYLQAGVHHQLNGVGGFAGWQWLFIVDGVISLPICIAGFFILPDLPENTRAFYLKPDERALALKRMEEVGRAPRKGLGRSAFKRIFGRWHVYFLSILYIIFINLGPSSSVSPFALWLKAKGESIERINIIPTAASAVQLVLTVTFAILSDALRRRASLMSVSTFLGGLASLLLAIWTIPEGFKWFAFFLQRASVAYGPLSMSWANEICGADAEERAIVIGIMNSLGYAFNTFVPLLTYPQVDAPRFRKGFTFTTALFCAQALITMTVAHLHKKERSRASHIMTTTGGEAALAIRPAVNGDMI